jgi:hypothetical protein
MLVSSILDTLVHSPSILFAFISSTYYVVGWIKLPCALFEYTQQLLKEDS